MTEQNILNQRAYMLRCEALSVLKRYPNKLQRLSHYKLVAQRRGNEQAQALASAAKVEYQNFLRWCSQSDVMPSHHALEGYTLDLAPVSSPTLHQQLETVALSFTPPWWSELPHLAPAAGVSHA